jgi:2-dehydropantoate 2-reductase
MCKRHGMRFVVYGAGAIGGVVGARLFENGHDVVLVARGAHYAAIRDGGLVFATPAGESVLPVPVVDRPGAIDWTGDETVLLAMKSQDTVAALGALAGAVHPASPIVCAQNGVANERAALRRFANVYGMCVMCPATHLRPGAVEANGEPRTGLLDVGRYPAGVDAYAEELAAALRGATFGSNAYADVMRWKYRKLLSNLGNAVDALCGRGSGEGDGDALMAMARAEGEACLEAAGIAYASEDEDATRRADLVRLHPAAGRRRQGGSTWQSLRRGTGSVETDFLNGEIVLLGRLHGVPVPVNDLLQHRMQEAAREGTEPGSVEAAALLAEALGRQ